MSARRGWVRLLFVAFALVFALVVAACSSDAKGSDEPKLTIVAKSGTRVQIKYELAADEASRSKGLSGRTQLDAESGMLFVLDSRKAGFWMKDTLIPLSVAFIANCGEIVFIAEMQPQSLEIHNTPRDYSFGLEANAGWFSRHGLAAGDQVQLPQELRPASCSPG